MLRRIPALAFTAVLALAVLVVGHNLVFLLTYGPQYSVALARTGHDGRWNDTVRDVLAASGLLAAASTLRLAYLSRQVRLIGPVSRVSRPTFRVYFSALLPLWGQVLAVSLLLFVFQENLERWSAGLTLPGLDVLGTTDLIGPVPVFVLVSLVVAAVSALFRLGIITLEARIAARRARLRPAASTPPRRLPTDPRRPATSILGRNLAGRAPPTLLSA